MLVTLVSVIGRVKIDIHTHQPIYTRTRTHEWWVYITQWETDTERKKEWEKRRNTPKQNFFVQTLVIGKNYLAKHTFDVSIITSLKYYIQTSHRA